MTSVTLSCSLTSTIGPSRRRSRRPIGSAWYHRRRPAGRRVGRGAPAADFAGLLDSARCGGSWRRPRTSLDVRPGEGRAVVLTFLYVALAVAGFLLAKPIRNGLFLAEYGAYSLVYAYVAVPLVLTAALPIYGLVSERVGTRAVITGSLVFFGLNVLLFWWAFRFVGATAWPASSTSG